MNFNIPNSPEYDLYKSQIDEVARLYGIKVHFLYTKKENINDTFLDFSHLSSDEYKEIYILPEDTEQWYNFSYNGWGSFNETINTFILPTTMIQELFPDFDRDSQYFKDILNSLLLFPSGQLVEITHIEPAQGIINQWAFNKIPGAYAITCKEYFNNKADDLNIQEVQNPVPKPEIDQSALKDEDGYNPTDAIQDFFDDLEVFKENQDKQSIEIQADNESVFGDFE